MTADELKNIIQSNTDHIGFKEMLEHSKVEGLVLEFGVASGGTIREIASQCDKVYGFDWFEGLPENWRPHLEEGAFKCDIPQVPENVELVVGLIQDTINEFLDNHSGMVRFVHIDVDLYSATTCIFNKLKDRIVSGTVIAFDELCVYNGYEEHEFKALLEFLNDTGHEIENIGSRHSEARTFRIK